MNFKLVDEIQNDHCNKYSFCEVLHIGSKQKSVDFIDNDLSNQYHHNFETSRNLKYAITL